MFEQADFVTTFFATDVGATFIEATNGALWKELHQMMAPGLIPGATRTWALNAADRLWLQSVPSMKWFDGREESWAGEKGRTSTDDLLVTVPSIIGLCDTRSLKGLVVSQPYPLCLTTQCP